MLVQNTLRKTAIGAAVAALLGGAASHVAAQTSAPGEDKSAIQEVIVTAQRVAQPASKTPLALVAVSGDDLKSAGAITAANLTEMVGNVQIGTGSLGATLITIRGIGSNDVTDVGDPSASFNLDGINLARPQGAGLAFFDLERVEVLRGPQGTLYGRNSTAGAVNLITNKPTDVLEGAASVEFGNHNTRRVDGFVNTKVNDLLSVRAAFASSQHDGYLYSTQNFANNRDDQDIQSLRLHALFKFSPDLRLLVSADGSVQKGAGSGQIPLVTFRNNTGKAARTTTLAVEGKADDTGSGVSAELNARTALGDVTYLAGYRRLHRDEITSAGNGGFQPTNYSVLNAPSEQVTHELRLASSFGALKTVVGLYSFRELSHFVFDIYNFVPGPGALGFHEGPTHSTSKAAFGQGTYSITPEVRATLGVRHTKDDKDRVGFDTVGSPAFLTTPNNAAVSYSVTNGKLGLDVDIAKNVMVYGSLSTGYKAGGFNNGDASNPFLYYNPERLTALEAGAKGRFLGGRLQLNASVFSYAYKDLQVTTVAISPVTGAPSNQTRNAAKASMKGMELEGKYVLNAQNKVDFAFSYLDATYDSYRPTLTSNWAGYRLERSPKTTLSLGYTHSWDFESGAELTAHLDARYSASYMLNDYNTPLQVTQPSFHKTNAQLTYAAPADKWSVQLYVKNIEAKDVIVNYSNFSNGVVFLDEPRTFGVRASMKF